MTFLHLLTVMVLLAVHALALGLWLRRWAGAPVLGLSVGVVAGVTVLFAVEHAIGLGSLRGLGVLTGLVSAGLIWRERAALRHPRVALTALPILLAVGWGLAWKLNFPSIYPTSERVTDLYFIVNYLDGARLPPVDHWFPPYAFDFYYALQHYAAALMGRWFALSPGLTYNLAFVLLPALTLALSWETARRLGLQRLPATLLLAALAVGGTGASLWTRLVVENPPDGAAVATANDRMWASARFVGGFDQRINVDWAERLFAGGLPPQHARQDLPLENLGYQYYVGDYHPPLGGFLLLAMALALMVAVHQAPTAAQRDRRLAALVATVPLCLAVNTWVFPLQALLVGVWALWQCPQWRRQAALWPALRALVLGGLATLFVLLPFLAGFSQRSLEAGFQWVSGVQHTPWVGFLVLHGPVLLLLALAAAVPPRLRMLAWPVATALAVSLLLTELFYVDDLSGGQYERTNTTMKGWGWIWTATLMGVAPAVLLSPRRGVRLLAVAALASTLVYVADIVGYWRSEARSDFGQLHAEAIYRRDTGGTAIISFLRAAPEGVVLERLKEDAYDNGGAYSAFAGKPLWLGWPLHEVTWRGQLPEIWQRRDAQRALFEARLEDVLPYLRAQRVDYIVWSAREARDLREHHAKLSAQLSADFHWHELARDGDRPIGVWARR